MTGGPPVTSGQDTEGPASNIFENRNGEPDMGEPVSDFERAAAALLAEERPDLVSELQQAAIAAHHAGQMWLCESDGVVRRGLFHRGTDYPCTGSAHYGGQRIECGNPIHTQRAANWYEPNGAA